MILVLALPALAGPLDLPHDFRDGDPILAGDFNDNFDEIAVAVNDNDARIAELEVGGVPAGAVMFFQLTSCPSGWERLGLLEGRVPVGLPPDGTLSATVGDPLSAEGARTIRDVPSHVHSVNPPRTTSTNTGSHRHSVDPPSTPTTIDGSHTHTVDIGNGGASSTHLQGSNTAGDSAIADSSAPIFNSGSHDHDVNISSFWSAFDGSHDHDVDIGPFDSASAGTSEVDVTMPYAQLLPCVKL